MDRKNSRQFKLNSLKKVLVAIKGEAVDEDALTLAFEMVHASKGKVFALYVIEVGRELPVDAELPDQVEMGEAILHVAERMAQEHHCDLTADILQAREAGPALIREAIDREADLIILGLPYKTRYGNFTLGDTAPYILENASCSVLILREPRWRYDAPLEVRASRRGIGGKRQ